MISNLSIKTLIPAIFMSRFAIIICMLIIGNWFVFIPWKIEEIGLSKKNSDIFYYCLTLARSFRCKQQISFSFQN